MAREFIRLERFIGKESIEELKKKRVAIVGLGAVGGFALEALARSAIGNFTLVDFDVVSETNINRQVLALHSTIGKKKTEIAAERVKDINPDVSLRIFDMFVDKSNYDLIFSDADLIIDAIDSLSAKVGLLESAYKAGIPIISSMGAALRRDPSLIRTADLYDSWGCPLAREVRSRLRRRGVGRGIDVVFSPEKVNFNYIPPEEDDKIEADDKILERGRKRVMLGSLSTVTAIFGETLAHLALKKLLKEGMLDAVPEWNPAMEKH